VRSTDVDVLGALQLDPELVAERGGAGGVRADAVALDEDARQGCGVHQRDAHGDAVAGNHVSDDPKLGVRAFGLDVVALIGDGHVTRGVGAQVVPLDGHVVRPGDVNAIPRETGTPGDQVAFERIVPVALGADGDIVGGIDPNAAPIAFVNHTRGI